MPWLWWHLLTSCLDCDVIYWPCLDCDVIYWLHALTVMTFTDFMPWLWWHLLWPHALGQLWCHLLTSWLDDCNVIYCNITPWLWFHLLTSYLECDVIHWLYALTVISFTMTSYVDCDVIYYDLMPWLWFHLVWPYVLTVTVMKFTMTLCFESTVMSFTDFMPWLWCH